MWGKNEYGVNSSQRLTVAEKASSSSDEPANRHLIAESAILLQKVIGQGEFGVVQQAMWTNDDGEQVSALTC